MLAITFMILKFLADNGFNPMWNEICEFEIFNPYFALIRFLVQDEDMFGDTNFIGQATYPVSTSLIVSKYILKVQNVRICASFHSK